MRHVGLSLVLLLVGCKADRWDGALMDSVDGTFAGEFDEAAMNHSIAGNAALFVEMYRCGRAQCADVDFEGVLANASAELRGPSSYTIRGVTIDYPELWSAFKVDGHEVRVQGQFQDDDRKVWLEIKVDVPPFGFVNVGEITLDIVNDDPWGPGLRD